MSRGPLTLAVRPAANPTDYLRWCACVRRGARLMFLRLEHSEEAARVRAEAALRDSDRQ